MVVEHISVKSRNGSNLTGDNNSYEYILEIYTKDKIGGLNKKAFYLIWNRLLLCRKRRTEIEQNVIRVFLKKGDTIQKYIDNITNVISQVNNHLEFMRLIKTKHRIKNPVLKTKYTVRSYNLAHKSSIRSKVWTMQKNNLYLHPPA